MKEKRKLERENYIKNIQKISRIRDTKKIN